jgi:hypothetical protein
MPCGWNLCLSAKFLRGQTLWDGVVEVYSVDHPKAKHAYGWSYIGDDKNEEFVAVLELPPVTSPQTAVKVAVGHAVKKARRSVK